MNQILDSVEAARLFPHLSPYFGWKTVEKMARNGEIPARKIGRRWYFEEEAIRRWLGTRKA